MKLAHVLISLLLAIAAQAMAQQTGLYLGKWSGSMAAMQGAGRQMSVELVVTPDGGTWRLRQQAGSGNKNPCFDKEFPISVISESVDQLSIAVDGEKVVRGCFNQSITVKRLDDKTLEAVLKDGRTARLAKEQ